MPRKSPSTQLRSARRYWQFVAGGLQAEAAPKDASVGSAPEPSSLEKLPANTSVSEASTPNLGQSTRLQESISLSEASSKRNSPSKQSPASLAASSSDAPPSVENAGSPDAAQANPGQSLAMGSHEQPSAVPSASERSPSVDSYQRTDSARLSLAEMCDAPPGHDAWSMVKSRMRDGRKDQSFQFRYRSASTDTIVLQTTATAAGGSEAAAKIARLCYVRISQGCRKAEVLAFRDELYDKCNPRRRLNRQPTPQPTKRARKVAPPSESESVSSSESESVSSASERLPQKALPWTKRLLESMVRRTLPTQSGAEKIVCAATKRLCKLPCLVEVEVQPGSTIHVVGDIHGQYWGLLHILDVCGEPSPTNLYLFNGDYVDRGQFSVEVALALLAMFVHAPDYVHLNRGNHESRHMNTIHGFQAEAERKYSPAMFELFCQAFDNMPVATLINRSVLVVHGGLSSQDGVRLEHIAALDHKRQVDEHADRLLLDLLWSDPMDKRGREPSPRGLGVLFGPDVSQRFCQDNNLACVIRSHEMVHEGYKWQLGQRCLTIFSAPNYCDVCGNLGAVCDITPRQSRVFVDDLRMVTFESSPHPTA
eukprot:TRINITY_DN5500_c0_g1_i1.p1 TRINITY_DN5500_c0_g1~~TRINITY_DN5500_c0_g1_i1.p1  ORF type:complete len:594 (+),score=79.93 TRINITY_DN5500_c0_g1_i1:31-1812(+)